MSPLNIYISNWQSKREKTVKNSREDQVMHCKEEKFACFSFLRIWSELSPLRIVGGGGGDARRRRGCYFLCLSHQISHANVSPISVALSVTQIKKKKKRKEKKSSSLDFFFLFKSCPEIHICLSWSITHFERSFTIFKLWVCFFS